MKIGVVTKADNKYFIGLRNLVFSLKITNPNIDLFVIDFGLTVLQQNLLKSYNIEVRCVENKYKAHKSTIIGTNYNNSIYGLMYLDLSSFDIILHLDADIVVTHSIQEIFTKLKRFDIVAPTDYPSLNLTHQLGNENNTCYIEKNYLSTIRNELHIESINAGVFAINKNTYRILKKELEYLYNLNLALPMRDQSILNLALVKLGLNIGYLDITYNFRSYFRRSPETKPDGYNMNRGVLSAFYKGNPIKIFHFIGQKPWEVGFDKNDHFYRIWDQFSSFG